MGMQPVGTLAPPHLFTLTPTLPSDQAGITQQGVNVSRGLLSQRDMLEDALRHRAEVRLSLPNNLQARARATPQPQPRP